MKKKRPAKRRQVAKIKAKRPAYKRFWLHPATAFLLLCIGVMLFGYTLKTFADTTDSTSYSVHGKVPAPPLTQPADITDPKTDSHVTATPVNVSGNCPPNSYVEIYRNDVFAGVAPCAGNIFSLIVDLTPGVNALFPRVFNITDDEGPLGTAVNVFYDAPQPSTASGSPSPIVVQSLVLTTDYVYRGYQVGQTVKWTLNLNGGDPPFAVLTNWGDGKETSLARKDRSPFDIEHSYSAAGNYTVKAQITDSDGQSSVLQLYALVRPSQGGSINIGNILQNLSPPKIEPLTTVLWLVWPVYAVVLLMVLSFWLGERQEYWNLASPKQRKSSRPHHR